MDKHLPSPWLMAGSAVAFALLFLALPQLDLRIGGWLYTADRGFLLRNDPVFDFVHEYIGVLGWLLCIGAGLYWLLARGGERTVALRMKRRAAAYVALALLLGPGLMVNMLFKDQWGRARPGQVTEFGGTALFTPAWVPSDQCGKNCSFVCGDASVGFGLLALAFVARRPRPWLVVGIGLGSALGLMRMAQGGHFLSDVVFSFYVVYFTAWFLHRLMFPPSPGGPGAG